MALPVSSKLRAMRLDGHVTAGHDGHRTPRTRERPPNEGDTLQTRTTTGQRPKRVRDEHVTIGVLAAAALILCCCAGCAGAVFQAALEVL